MKLRVILVASIIFAILLVPFCSNLPYVMSERIVFADWASPTTSDLFSVFMLDDADGWAVGQGGTIIHWDGSNWSNTASPIASQLNSVFMTNADDGWAVGSGGTIIHWDGNTWRNSSSPTQYDLWSVAMVNPLDGWAVGYGGVVINWNGTEWKNVASPTIYTLFSVSILSANDVWAAGVDFIHWNGTAWEKYLGIGGVPSPHSLFMINSNYGWAAGDLGMMWYWNGTLWTPIDIGATKYTFYSVFFTTASDGWAVGEWSTLVTADTAVILHWDGSQWTLVEGFKRVPLYSVYMLNVDEGWLVGNAGTIGRWNGVQWVVPEFPKSIGFVVALLALNTIIIRKVSTRNRKPFT